MTTQIFAAFFDELEKIAGDASLGAFNTAIESELARKNIDAAKGYAHRGINEVGDALKTKGGRNAALAALGAAGVAGGTLYARQKLEDMKQGARERRMRELSQG